MTPIVVDDKPASTTTVPRDAPQNTQAAVKMAIGETVVFPHNGPSVDQRPDELKRQRAAQRYKENGPDRRKRGRRQS
jgi:hypothetical protein